MTTKISSKDEWIKFYNQQGYRTLEIPINLNDPKALVRKGWNTEPTNLKIGKNNLYAVVQEDNKLTFDFDDTKYNDILNDYLDKTLIIQTGNGGRHFYFKDIKRVKPIKISTLYKNGKVIGDIKAHMSYVVGCGSSYQEDGKTKTYTQISSVNTVLEIDCEIILQILKKNGITTTNEIEDVNQDLKDQFNRGEIPTESQSNNYFFLAALDCRDKDLTKKEAEEKIKPIYNEWAKSKHYSGRTWSNITIKINDAYKNPPNKKLETPATIQIYNIGMKLIEKSVKSENDTEQIVIKVKLHDKYHWIDNFSNTFIQMIRLENQKQHKKIYADSTYLTAIKNIHANFLLNNTITKPVFNRSALIDNVLYYDLQDNDGIIYKISKDEISEAQNDNDIPIFLKSPSAKTSTSTQPKPLFDNDKAFDELVKLFRIKDEDKIIFKSHLICHFFTNFPIPIL